MRPFVPHRMQHVAFGLLLSGLMSFLISGIATFLAIGVTSEFLAAWIGAWLPSWMIAFPTVLVVAPLVRRILAKVVMPAPQVRA